MTTFGYDSFFLLPGKQTEMNEVHGRYEPYRLICQWLNIKRQVGVLLGAHRGWMLHMAFSYKAKNIAYNSMLSYALTYSILLSTSRRLVPLSLQNGKRAACLPFVELLSSYLYTREHSASRLKSQFSSLKSVFSA